MIHSLRQNDHSRLAARLKCVAKQKNFRAHFTLDSGRWTLDRSAFTLVELLVAMTIFVILATLAIGAWRGTDADRVSNAAANFKNALEGAKSRAVKSSESRGLRLLLDPNDPNFSNVTSMVYVDGGRLVSGKLYAEFDNRGTGDTGYNSLSSGRWRVAPTDGSWTNLLNRNLIGPGTLIEIPDGKSTWLRLTGTPSLMNTDTIGGIKWWVLEGTIYNQNTVTAGVAPHYTRGGYTYGSQNISEGLDGGSPEEKSTFGLETATASGEIDYRMQLMPAVLAGAEPVALPLNTCIDLDGSKVPTSWRPATAGAGYGPQSGFMDILFTPRGTVARPLTTAGLLHFRVASSTDVLLSRTYSSTGLPNGTSNPIVVADPERGAKLVSIITQTGTILNADVSSNGDTNGEFNNEVAPNPFNYVIYGQESK